MWSVKIDIVLIVYENSCPRNVIGSATEASRPGSGAGHVYEELLNMSF